MKAVIYARFSPRPNAAECQSLEIQIQECREYCVQRGYELAAEPFCDRELSGGDEDRPALWQAIETLRRGWVLIVWKLDRMARSVFLSEYLHREARRKGFRIDAVHGNHQGESPEDVVLRQVLAAFDEYERKMTALRTRLAMRRYQASGIRMSAHIPYGYREDPDSPLVRKKKKAKIARHERLLPDAEEQHIIELICGQHTRGLSPRAICRELASRGLQCRGRNWSRGTIERILRRANSLPMKGPR